MPGDLRSRRTAAAPFATLQIQQKTQSYEDLLGADGFVLGHVFARSDKNEGFFMRSATKFNGSGEDRISATTHCCLAAKCSSELHSTGCMCESLQKEYEILKGLKHPNIVVAKHLVVAKLGCAMVMELCPGERLDRVASKAGGLQAQSQRTIIDQVLCATVYLHNLEVAHRDLHCGNIIVNAVDHAVKVVDFNCACRGLIKSWYTSCSESMDQPLELDDLNLSILPPRTKDGVWDMFSLDIFAIGLLTLGLMVGRIVDASEMIANSIVQSLSRQDFPRNIASYVRSLLSYQPIERPSAAMARENLPDEHEWQTHATLLF